MFHKILFTLSFYLLLANALPRPLDWHLTWLPSQQTLDFGASRAKQLVEWMSNGNAEHNIHHFSHPHFDSSTPYENKTVWQAIQDDPKFSRLVKAVKFADGIEDILDNSDTRLTFFAVPNWALKRPKNDNSRSLPDVLLDGLITGDDTPSLATVIGEFEAFDTFDGDDEDKERRRKILRALVTVILKYHILPKELSSVQLAEVSTFETNLHLPWALADQAQRIRVETSIIPPKTVINMFSKIVTPDIQTQNGVMHVVNHPLLPPLTAFRGVYILPSRFAYFTSAAQRSGLTLDLDLLLNKEKSKEDEPKFDGSDVVTTFIPVNSAFDALPKELQFFLFSPFGERALRKILEYHVVPDIALLSDFLYNGTSKEHVLPSSYDVDISLLEDASLDILTPSSYPPSTMISDTPDIISVANYTLPTLLRSHPIEVDVVKFNVSLPYPGPTRPHHTLTKIYVNRQKVAVSDIPALNGAAHVLGSILDPRKSDDKKAGGGDGWEDWEDWLPQWAEEQD